MVKSRHTENRYAVCIGINAYPSTSGLGTLHYAEADARDMDALLARLGFPDEHRIFLPGPAATLDAITAALEEFILDKPQENDLVLFYFAGHSKPLQFSDAHQADAEEAKGEVFLAPYDFDVDKIRQSRAFRSQRALGMKRLRQAFFEGEGSRKRLFLLDSCYSGDLFGPKFRDDSNPVQGYIQHMLDSESGGRVALLSCLPTQKAREVAELGHGLFTYYLLRALSGEDSDALRSDGWLSVGSLFEYLSKKLPPNQQPVRGGVEQGAWNLIHYPQHIQQKQEERETLQDRKQEEKQTRLRSMFADHSSFLRDRLESFVGREEELGAIRQHIQATMPTGGYVTITGQAGQGKSSVIAHLIKERIEARGTEERVAYHFIPFPAGPDHQVGLLRNVIARLMFIYDLSDLYVDYVAHGNRSALQDFFLRVLREVVEKGGQEVIFIDGLDQLEEDVTGGRDLNFLPSNPPQGIVFVLGTRPDDTLHPLKVLKPYVPYPLPNLSRSDFDRLLHHRKVQLSPAITEQFYHVMQENALFLDLVAKELTAVESGMTPDEIIKKLVKDPKNLFSFALTRFQRSPDWEIIEAVLGLLLASREPFLFQHLRHGSK